METKSFRDLIVWQKAKNLAILLYKTTEALPKSELFGLTGQMRRATISISSNIAEGYNRAHAAEKRQFLMIAFASGSELESQIEITEAIFPTINFAAEKDILIEVQKMLNKLTRC